MRVLERQILAVHALGQGTEQYDSIGWGDVVSHAEMWFLGIRDGSISLPARPNDPTLGSEVESFATYWHLAVDAGLIELSPGESKTADTLVRAAVEMASTDDPPNHVLREIFRWLLPRANRAADAYADHVGTSAAIGTGVLISGKLPQLVEIAQNVLRLASN
jgi:hypothetical protein